MPSEHPKPGPLTHHGAHALAAKLRRDGVYASGKDVLTWPFNTIRLAQVWVTSHETGRKVAPWAEYMGAELPPASPQSWLPLSAGSHDGDRAGS